MHAFSALPTLALLAVCTAPLRAQDDTTRLREGRGFAQSLEADTLHNPLWRYSFYYDDPKPTSSQGRTTEVTYWTDKIGRVQLIQTSVAKSQRIWNTIYYLRYDSLLYATEEEVLALKSGEDWGRVVWTAEYAFRDGRLAGLSSNGHGKSELDNWQPEVYVPADFKQARGRITAYRRRRTSARK